MIEDVEFDDGGGKGAVVVVHARPRRPKQRRCGCAGIARPGYDRVSGRRRWRAMSPGTVRAFVKADAPRVRCAEHGVVVAAVAVGASRVGGSPATSRSRLPGWRCTPSHPGSRAPGSQAVA